MSFLKKIILISFLTVFSTFNLWASSCPNLTGRFACLNTNGKKRVIFVSQKMTDGVISYLITDADSGKEAPFEFYGIKLPMVTDQKGMIDNYFIETTCSERVFIIHGTNMGNDEVPFDKFTSSFSRTEDGSLRIVLEMTKGHRTKTQPSSCSPSFYPTRHSNPSREVGRYSAGNM